MSKIILQSKVTAYNDDKKIDAKYRMILFKKDGKWQIAPEQSFDGEFNEFSGLPAWDLAGLLHLPPDTLYINFRQKWSISGLRNAIEEAQKIASL